MDWARIQPFCYMWRVGWVSCFQLSQLLSHCKWSNLCAEVCQILKMLSTGSSICSTLSEWLRSLLKGVSWPTGWLWIISLKGEEGIRCGILRHTIWSAIWRTTTATSHKKSVSRVGSHIRTQTAPNLNRILHMFQPDCFQSQWLYQTIAQHAAWSKYIKQW